MMHADILDEAAEREQQMIEIALANRKHPEMRFTGACYYCEESVDKGFFCCSEAGKTMSALSALSSIARWHESGS